MARKKSASKKARELLLKESGAVEVVQQKVENVEKNETPAQLEVAESSSDSSDESSESEEEDDYGELITDNIEQGISKVLNAIKTGDKALFDPSVKFFDDATQAETVAKKESHKPIYLKDYHRMNLLSGNALKDDDEDDREWEDGEKPFAIQQREEKKQLLSEIKDAFSGEGSEDEDDDFITKKSTQREITPVTRLPRPAADENKFLEAFMESHAWIPAEGDQEVDLDARDDEEFDDAVEKFEHAYNFRYEDPKSAEIVSYARNQATLRRSKTNSRKLLREKELEIKNKEKLTKEQELSKKKQKKIAMVSDRLLQIKEAVGGEVSDEVITKVFGDSLLKDDFDDADWDTKMAQIFDEAYYDAEATKPDFGDDEVMAGFEGDEDEDDEDILEEEAQEDEKKELEDEEEVEEEEPKPKTKKDKLKDKKSKKKEKELLKKTAEKIVLKNTAQLVDEIEEEQEQKRGRSEARDVSFKYREVSPESFGLTTREILTAQDKDLNELIGIKKFAPYRPRELRMKDKRKLTKSYKLKEWRKKVFRSSKGLEIGDDVELGFKKRKHHKDSSEKKHKKHKKEEDQTSV